MHPALTTALVIFGLLNMAFAGAVYAHNRKNVNVIFFSLISVFASLWSISTLLTSVEALSLWQFKLAVYGHYLFGFGAYLAGYWFAYFYPTRSEFSITLPISLSIIVVSFLSFIPTSYFFTSIQEGATLAERLTYNFLGHGIFIGLISLVYFMVVWQLTQKLRKAEDKTKKQIHLATIEMLLVGASGIVLNLVLPLFGNFTFFYITPFIQTLILTGIGIYNLSRNHLFNAKIILAEFFTGGMVIVSIARLFISTTTAEQITNILLLIATVGFGIFLIRSVTKEVEQREEIQRLAENLKQANERLKELDKLKSQFLSIASHDLRAPLTVIRNFMSLLIDGTYGKLAPAAEEGLRQVFDRASDMAKSVDTYLNVSRIEQGRMKYDFIQIEISPLVEAAVKGFSTNAEKKGLDLSLSITPEIRNSKAKLDVTKINEVFNNLLDNSIKYTPKGSIAISLEKIGQVARLVIQDTGVGMSQETIRKLFKLFSTGEESQKINISSTGVGLYITKAHVEAHGGHVWAESDGEGRGSRFIVELPLQS